MLPSHRVYLITKEIFLILKSSKEKMASLIKILKLLWNKLGSLSPPHISPSSRNKKNKGNFILLELPPLDLFASTRIVQHLAPLLLLLRKNGGISMSLKLSQINFKLKKKLIPMSIHVPMLSSDSEIIKLKNLWPILP